MNDSTESTAANARGLKAARDHLDHGRYADAAEACLEICRVHPGATEAIRQLEMVLEALMTATNVALQKGVSAADAIPIDVLRARRVEIVRILRGLPLGLAERLWQTPFRDCIESLAASGLKYLPRNAAEAALCEEIVNALNSMPQIGSALGGEIIAASLLLGPGEVPLLDRPGDLPDWLARIYLGLITSVTEMYLTPGGADAFVKSRIRCAEWSNQQYVQGDSWKTSEMREFAARAFIVAPQYYCYFSELNLRPLYATLGRLANAFLQRCGELTAVAISPRWEKGSRIRLGVYVKSMRLMPEPSFLLAHLHALDRSRFDITLIVSLLEEATGEPVFRRLVDRVVLLEVKELREQVEFIRSLDLDIFLHGSNASTGVRASALLAHFRLARIQMMTVSSPVTTGALHADYMLTAEWNEPAVGAQEHYTERLVRMPGAVNYYAFNYDAAPATVTVSRELLGIGTDQIVFFSGANFYKIVPELSRVWAKVLAAVPNSVLVLMPFNANWSEVYPKFPFLCRIHGELAEQGVTPKRLVVVNPVPTRADVHRVLALADVYLDAHPFAGACSMLDPIQVGVPAVAWRGQAGRSNHGAAMLRMVGLEELAATSEDEYIKLAVGLAQDAGRRSRVREQLLRCAQMQPPPYFDHDKFSRRVGEALENLYAEHCDQYLVLKQTEPARLRQMLQKLADTALPASAELQSLTDERLVRALVKPYLMAARPAGDGRMIDVGACYGVMATPFLDAGWRVDLFEPDPGARAVLSERLKQYGGRANIFSAVVSNQQNPTLSFRRAATHGLSGLDDSPFAPTQEVLEVENTTLRAHCARHAIASVDFLKIDAEGHDFEVLASNDFALVRPRLVMVEFGSHFRNQSVASVQAVIRAMEQEGYFALCVSYAAGKAFGRQNWDHHVADIAVDRLLADGAEPVFGNILFYQRDDWLFLLHLHTLLTYSSGPAGASANADAQ